MIHIFDDEEFCGVTTLGAHLGTTDTFGRQLAMRKDFPEPTVMIRTSTRTVSYWRASDVAEFGRRYAEQRAAAKERLYGPAPAPPPERSTGADGKRSTGADGKRKRLSRPELRARAAAATIRIKT